MCCGSFQNSQTFSIGALTIVCTVIAMLNFTTRNRSNTYLYGNLALCYLYSMLSVHHASKRKRIFKKKEQYPSSKFLIRILDKAVFVAAIISAVMTLPQVWIIF